MSRDGGAFRLGTKRLYPRTKYSRGMHHAFERIGEMMHDPMTVAFDIKSPFRNKPSELWPQGYRKTLITIWHIDPETDHTDDSCDWFNRKRPLNAKEKALAQAIFEIENVLDNRPHYPDSPEHMWYQTLKDAYFQWKRRERPWWQHPRWHIHHWKLQIHPWQAFYRWAFERCAVCGGRFAWGESVIGSWSGKKIWHCDCETVVQVHREEQATL